MEAAFKQRKQRMECKDPRKGTRLCVLAIEDSWRTQGRREGGGAGRQAGICGFSRQGQGLGSLDFKCEGKPLGGLKLWRPLPRPLPRCL